MDVSRGARVEGRDGLKGEIVGPPAGGRVEVLLESGQRLVIPVELLQRRNNRSYFLPFGLNDHPAGVEAVVPVVEEQIEVGKQIQPTAEVAVYVAPRVRHEVVDVELIQEQVEVQRVPINRPVDTPPPMRQDGDVTIIPVLEEVLLVQKQLMLKEEVHITRRRTTQQERHDVPIRSEEVRVLRAEVEAEGTSQDQGQSHH